jgi:hypothetical protein
MGFEEPLPRTEDDRLDEDPVLVDQTEAVEGLSERGAAVDLNLSLVAILELGHFGDHVAADDRGRLPLGVRQGGRDDVLGQGVEPRGHRVVLVGEVRPAGGEDLVGSAAEQEAVGSAEGFVDHFAHVGACEGKAPSPVREPAVAILIGTSGCLHDPVEGHERCDCELAHAFRPSGPTASDTPLTLPTITTVRNGQLLSAASR